MSPMISNKFIVILITLALIIGLNQLDVYKNEAHGHFIVMYKGKTLYKNW